MKFLLPTLILLGATSVALAQTAAKPSPPRKPAKPIQAAQVIPERELTPEELEVASRVYAGRLPCELGQMVTITPDAKSPGYFDLTTKKMRFRMHAVQSKSGAVRLDAVSGDAAWIQLSNKSMLVNAKLGQRMADVCTSPEQLLVAQAFEKTPPPSLFDEPAPAAVPTKILTQTDACQAAGLSMPKTNPLTGENPC
jgi:hypothetical protein